MKKIKLKLKLSFWEEFLLYGFSFCKSLSLIFLFWSVPFSLGLLLVGYCNFKRNGAVFSLIELLILSVIISVECLITFLLAILNWFDSPVYSDDSLGCSLGGAFWSLYTKIFISGFKVYKALRFSFAVFLPCGGFALLVKMLLLTLKLMFALKMVLLKCILLPLKNN